MLGIEQHGLIRVLDFRISQVMSNYSKVCWILLVLKCLFYKTDIHDVYELSFC